MKSGPEYSEQEQDGADTPQARVVTAPLTSDQRQLVETHCHLPVKAANKAIRRGIVPPHLDKSDLVSAGAYGLVRAAVRYDGSTLVPFRTFAERRVGGAVLDEIRQSLGTTRFDRAFMRRYRALPPELSDEEKAAALTMQLPDYYAAHRAVVGRHTLSLHDTADSGSTGDNTDDETFTWEHADPQAVDPERYTLAREVARAVFQEAGASVHRRPGDQREAPIICLYYGEDLDQSEIGPILQVDHSRISQLRNGVLQRVRKRLGI